MSKKLPVIQSNTEDNSISFDDLLSGKFDVTLSKELKLIPDVKKTHTKESISYSEISTWLECNWRHKLKYVEKIDLDGPSIHTEFGQVLHDMLEEYIKSRTMPLVATAKAMLTERFEKLKKTTAFEEELSKGNWHDAIEPILESVPKFLNEEFPGWEYVATEAELYEDIPDENVKKFKGFIDAVIKVPKNTKDGGYKYWIIDHKTTSWGWRFDKKNDPKKILQLVFYKYFWATKNNVPLKDVQCAFLLLKRTTKKERCELVKVSVGDATVEKALKTLSQFLGMIKKGFAPKNRNSCKYCIYKGTEHCV
jgi:hypothetical protein